LEYELKTGLRFYYSISCELNSLVHGKKNYENHIKKELSRVNSKEQVAKKKRF